MGRISVSFGVGPCEQGFIVLIKTATYKSTERVPWSLYPSCKRNFKLENFFILQQLIKAGVRLGDDLSWKVYDVTDDLYEAI